MKSNRNRAFLKNVSSSEEKSLFAITPILINIIAIAVFVFAYWYIYTHNILVDYTTYIYWTMNVLVTYNIIAASARSFWAPILAIGTALFSVFSSTVYGFVFLSSNEFWQLLIVGVIGLVITLVLKL